MNGQASSSDQVLTQKIALLIEERGWNQEDFSRLAKLNRQTVRRILRQDIRRLRSATIRACAAALGLPVDDLKSLTVQELLPRMKDLTGIKGQAPPAPKEDLRRLFEQATQPELQVWIDRNPQRAESLTGEELDELLSLQGVGGPLTAFGVEHFAAQIERRRKLLRKVRAVAGTELVELLEKLVDLMFHQIQPYADRK